ncbi:uncharacterized protein LOC106142841 isoform X1 [Amyelois transitella]|uniref:uncharacterized protein LOC106142841 isoform X1 n=2 Tax=Amyelois transitella TaxID=680683 RepID=UPI002990623F|nr:uncharacterized protein LOC106142841 isoform X1 [Amyelois transitella]
MVATKLFKMAAVIVLAGLSLVAAAPVAQNAGGDGQEGRADVPVEQLEKLKMAESGKEEGPEIAEHVEYHRIDAVKTNGELVSRLEEHASADSAPGEKPKVHAQAQLDLPSEGVHKVLVQDGGHVSVQDAVPTAAPSEEVTAKIFHGAARLVQPGSATSNPQNGHTAARRAFNADITKETKNNVDHYSSYTGVQYSPLDMAEYVFWTGDERGVTTAIEDFLQEGLMTKEEAIAFLQEIKFNIEYLRAHYSQNLKAVEESVQQEKLRNMLMEQANAKEYQYRNPVSLQSFPFGNSPDIIRTIANKNWELSNNLSPIPILPVTSDVRPEPMKRTYDPMLQTNIISTSDYDRDGQIITEEEYEEMMDKLKAADTLYTEYTLEEIIYQLAKMMFSQSLSRDPASARAATQRFMAFLELEAERGQLSRTIEKKVLDVMIAALTDTIGDHPELLQAHEGLGINPSNRLMHQFLEASAAEPSMSRAILAAYKDELLKGPPLHKLAFPERN